ncbi:MAG TPA: winged helix-turn-helix domain-containing protein [Steroidobacteraceae bacterium]|nr:winged helix-turn-helix domain-containing protein [Steroidobacteraceae bacterium]
MESAPPMKTSRSIAFDGWVLHADIGELVRDGQKVRLQQLPLLVLEELLARPGELVTREQLIARLWPKGVVDFDTGLNTAVRKLRVALGDVAEVPRYIETIPRKGYRFLAAVNAPADGSVSDAAVVTPVEPAVPPALPGANEQPPVTVERRVADRRDGSPVSVAPVSRPRALTARRAAAFAAGLVALLIAVGVVWWVRGSDPAPAHETTVRLSGFQLLSADLPAALPKTVEAELTAAFSHDGVVGVSSAPAAAAGATPAYSLGGTIQRDGQTIRVITRLVNERSGETLWSNTSTYDGMEVSRVPRHIAVDAGNVVRCGLFGASTYHKPLPDGVLRDYLQFCQGHWDPNIEDGRKALVPAQRVVAAVPDFSWGWAALAGAYWKVASSADTDALVEEARASGRQAADRAVAIDPKNSEALYIKSMVVDRRDWIGREELLKRAVAAHRLDCGCEHHQYGWMLLNVGRTNEAVERLRQANDMLALYVYTPLNLAQALVVAGKPDLAKPHFDTAIDLAPNSGFAQWLVAEKATQLGDVELLLDPKLPMDPRVRAALVQGFRARASRDPAVKQQAVDALLALNEKQQTSDVARVLGDLGAQRDAFRIAARIVTGGEYPGPTLLWDPSLRGILADPGFPALVTQLGLLEYWRKTGTRPDVCGEAAAPAFCKMI